MRSSTRAVLGLLGLGLAAGAVAAVLLAAGGDEPSRRAAGPAVSSDPSPSPSATPSPSPSPSASPSPSPFPPPRIELRGDDLAVTRVGDPREQAVPAVVAVLGPGDADPPSVSCVGSDTEVAWPDLRLGFDAQGRLNGWVAGTPRLQTPSGVRVGTAVRDLRRIYGDRLRLFPPNPDGGHSFDVAEVDLVGFLDGDAPDSRVTALANGACTGP